MNPSEKFRVWCDMSLPESLHEILRQGVSTAGGELILARAATASNLVISNRDEIAQESNIAFGQPNPLDIIESSRMQWVHLNTAGYAKYDDDDLRRAMRARGAILTNSSSVYDEPCAQHLLAFMMSQARQLPQAIFSQQKSFWDFDRLRPRARVLEDQNALIVGFGAIGKRLAEMLKVLKVNLCAVRRQPRGNEPIEVQPIERLDDLLGGADHVIDVLPASASTNKMFSASRFAAMRHGASFYNVGRGDTVDQIALREALQSNHLASAYLDVTTPEPLPADDPLWRAPNCYITPHIAGGMQDEQLRLIRHFLANLNRRLRNDALLDRLV